MRCPDYGAKAVYYCDLYKIPIKHKKSLAMALQDLFHDGIKEGRDRACERIVDLLQGRSVSHGE